MVVFVDLEDDLSDDPHANPNDPRAFSSLRKHHLGDKVTAKPTAKDDDENIEERPNPNLNSLTAALAAYPYVRPPASFRHPSISVTINRLTYTQASSPN